MLSVDECHDAEYRYAECGVLCFPIFTKSELRKKSESQLKLART
jgi:hypothetical protein